MTDAPVNSTINLPTLTGNGTYHFYIQSTGTQGVLNTVVLFGSNRIYNDYDSWSSVSLPIPTGNTYKYTYYHKAGNPWDIDNIYPSCSMETLSGTEIPLNNNIEIFLIFSIGGGYTTPGTLYMPSAISDGQCITFKDYNGALSTSNIVLKATTGKTINGNSSITLHNTTNSMISKYVYADSMLELISL